MTATCTELGQLVSGLKASHASETLVLAATRQLATSLLRRFGRQHGSDLSALVDTLQDCFHSHLFYRRIAPGAVDHAAAGIRHAGKTVAHLDALKD